jgi:hypothetical protein
MTTMTDPESALPQWWNDRIEAAWRRSRAAAVREWEVLRVVTSPLDGALDASIEQQALAFGHGARSAYPDRVTWDTVAPQLRADWDRLGHVGPASWDAVAHIIRHEWTRAGGPGGDVAPERSADRP